MPRKRQRSPPSEKCKSENDDDDFFLDDTQSLSGRSGGDPPQRNAANARERARMRVLSKAFCRLKTTLPWVPADTKLSKLDTLRLASSYIAHLRAVLQQEPAIHGACPHPLNLAWPFAFQHGGGSLQTTSPSTAWSPGSLATPTAEPLAQTTFENSATTSVDHENSSNYACYDYSLSCRDDYFTRNHFAVNDTC